MGVIHALLPKTLLLLAHMNLDVLEQKLNQAVRARSAWSNPQCNCYRLVNGLADDLPGLTIDRYNAHFQIQLFQNDTKPYISFIQQWLQDCFLVDFLVIKYRLSADGISLQNPQWQVLLGKEEECTTLCMEHGVLYQVDLLDTINPGLFLDMKVQREKILEQSAGKQVLNLFSYTCSFGLVAAMGGALHTTNVDISSKILEKGKQNYTVNGLATDTARFIRRDSKEYIKACIKSQKQFDIIILDPPSFSRNKGKVFSVKKDLENMILDCCAICAPCGALQVSTNYSGLTPNELQHMAKTQIARCNRRATVEPFSQSADFQGSFTVNMKESALSGVEINFLQ